MPANSDSNIVQIIIQAKDAASATTEQIKSSFLSLGAGAIAAQQQIALLGTAISGLVNQGTAGATRLGAAIGLVKSTLSSPVAKNFLTSIGESAEQALSEIQPLNEILGSTKTLFGGVVSGFASKSGESPLLKRVKSQISEIQNLQASAKDPTEGIGGGLQARLERLQQVQKQFGSQKTTGERFEDVSKKLGQGAVDAFTNLPVDRIPFVEKLLNKEALARAVQPLDGLLSSVVLDTVIKRKIPDSLKVTAQTFGQDLTQATRGLASQSASVGLVSKAGKDLIGGSTIKAAESGLSEALTRGFGVSFVQADKLVGGFTRSLGEKVAASLSSSSEKGFSTLDSLFSGKIGVAIDKAAANIAPKLVDKSGLANAFKAQVGGVLNDTVATSIISAIPVGGFSSVLLHAFGDQSLSDGFKKATGGALVDVGEKLSDLTGLTKTAESGFKKLFTTILSSSAKGALGAVFSQLTTGVESILPPQIKKAFAVIEQIFPEQIAQLKTSVIQDVEKVFTNIIDLATLSPVDKIGKQIEKFKTVAEGAGESAANIEKLQQAATQTVGRTDISSQAKETIIKQFNAEIAAAQAKLKEAEEANGQIESLQKEQTQLKEKPKALQEAATQTLADPTLDVGQKNKIAADLTQQIEQAESQLKSPLQKLADGVNSFVSKNIKLDASGGGNGGGAGIAQALAASFTQADDFLENTLSTSLKQIGGTAAKSFGSGFSGGVIAGLAPAINQVDSFILSTVHKVEAIPEKLTNLTGTLANTFGAISGAAEPLEVFNLLKDGIGGVAGGIFNVTQEIGQFSIGLQALQQFATTGPFETLIGQNVKLREQLLATQSTLAGTNKVISAGQTVGDPTLAIQSLEGPVNSAIAKIRKGSLDLVNVTSKDLIESFQIIAGQAGNLGFNLDQAAKITLSFGATLGTLGVPLYQARQEITSILTGTIDSNSAVAKSLAITNQQVETWKQQNSLVENLTKRMEAFKSGNALAAKTLGGVTSNIQELADEIGRLAGEPLLEPIVKQLGDLYDYINSNKDALVALASAISKDLVKIVESGANSIRLLAGTVGPVFAQIPVFLFNFLARSMEEFEQAVKVTVTALKPFLDVMAQLIPIVIDYGGHFLKLFIQFKVLTFGITGVTHGFDILAKIMPGVGDLLFVLTGRTNPLIQTFTALRGTLGTGASGFLLLAKNMNSIPGIAGALTKSLGPIGGILAPIIPGIAGIGLQVVGVANKVPFLQSGLQNLLSLNPSQLTNEFIKLGGQFKVLQPFIPTMRKLSDEFTVSTKGASLSAIATQKFGEATKSAGLELRKFLVSTTLIGVGLFAAVYLLENFILKNKAVQIVLASLTKTLQSVGQAISDFLTSPFGIALESIAAIVAITQLQLIPKILSFGKALAVTGAEEFNSTLGGIQGAISKFTTGVNNVAVNLGEKLGFGKAKDIKKGADQVAQVLAEDSANFERSVASKKQAIDELEAASQRQQNLESKGVKLKSPADVSGLGDQKQKLQQELDVLLAGRDQQVAALKQKAQQEFAALNPPASIGERFTQFSETIKTKATGSLAQFQGVAQRLSGDSLTRLGQGISTLGFDKLGVQAAEAGNKLYGAGAATLASEKALSGIGNTSKLAGLNISSIGASAKGAAGAMGAGFRAAGTAVTGFIATFGPMLALTAAIYLITEGISAIIAVNDAATASQKRFTEAIQDSIKKSDELEQKRKAKAGEPEKGSGKTTAELQEDRLKDIQKDQNPFAKAVDSALGGGYDPKANKATNEAYDNLVASEKKLKELQEQRAIAAQSGNKKEVASIDEKIQATQKNVDSQKAGIEKIKESGSQLGGGNLGFSGSQLSNEVKGFDDTLKAANESYAEFANERYAKQADLQGKLGALQNKKAEVAARGDKTDDLDEQIKLTQEAIEGNKNVVQSAVDGLTKEQPLTQKQLADKELLLKKLSGLQEKYDKLGQTAIAPLDLPRVGSAVEQLQAKVAKGISDLTKGTGNKEQVEASAKAALESVQKLREAGAISGADAEGAIAKLVNTDKLGAELQEQAQQALTKVYQDESQKRVDNKEAEVSEIQTKIRSGALTEAEGEKQISQKKVEEIAVRLKATKDAASEEDRIRAEQLQKTLAGFDQQIGEAQKVAALAKTPEEKQKADAGVEDLKGRRKNAQDEYNNQVTESNRKVANEEKKSAEETSKTVQEGKLKQLELAEKKAVDVAKIAEGQRLVEVQKLQNAGVITAQEAEEQKSQASKTRIQSELQAEQKRLAELQKNPKGNEALIRESRLKTIDLTRQSLEAEEKLYESHIASVKAKIQNQQNAILLSVQQRINAGTLTEKDAEAEKAGLTVARLQQEVALETKHSDKRLQLELELEQAKGQLKKAELAKEAERIRVQTQATVNAYTVEVQALQRQVLLYDTLNKALEQRNALLNAVKDLTSAAGSFLTGELDALAKTEKSEVRKRDIAKITAAIKLEALRKEQEISQITFELEQKKNELALKRKEIENRSQITQQKSDVAKGAGDLKIAANEFKAGLITKEDFDAKKLDQQAKVDKLKGLEEERGLIQEEKRVQPQLAALQRQKLQLEQRSQITQARTQAFEALSPGEQAQQRAGFQQETLSTLFGGKYKSVDDLRAGVLGSAKNTLSGELSGKTAASGQLLTQGTGLGLTLPSAALQPDQRTLQSLKSIAPEQPSPLRSNRPDPLSAQSEQKSGVSMTNTFSITVNANTKDVGQKTGDQVQDYLQKVLKKAAS